MVVSLCRFRGTGYAKLTVHIVKHAVYINKQLWGGGLSRQEVSFLEAKVARGECDIRKLPGERFFINSTTTFTTLLYFNM